MVFRLKTELPFLEEKGERAPAKPGLQYAETSFFPADEDKHIP
jgi:hypothetical protein